MKPHQRGAVTPRREGDVYVIPVTILVIGCPRGLPSARRGAGPGHSIRPLLRSRPRALGQSNGVRERSTCECGNARQGRPVRLVAQSRDEKPRQFHDNTGAHFGWHALPLGAPSHRRRPTAGYQLPLHLVPHAKRRVEDQELTRRVERRGLISLAGGFTVAEHRSPSRHLIARSFRGGPPSLRMHRMHLRGWEERRQAIAGAAANADRDGGADQGVRGEPLLSGRR